MVQASLSLVKEPPLLPGEVYGHVRKNHKPLPKWGRFNQGAASPPGSSAPPPTPTSRCEEMQGLVAPGLSLSLPLIATPRMRENKWRRVQKASPRLWGCRKGRHSALSVNVAQVPQVLPARQQKLDLSLLHMHHSPGPGVRHSCACSPACRSCSYGSGPSTSATQC